MGRGWGGHLPLTNVLLCGTGHFSLCDLRKSKEEYEEEMSRRLMSGEDVGSTSSVCSTHPTEGRAESNKSPDHTAKVKYYFLFAASEAILR